MIRRWREFRKRLRHKRFLRLYDLPKEGVVLDISCGDGDFLAVLRSYFPELDLHGIDISPEYIESARAKHSWATLATGNAEEVPYADDTFHVVLSCMSLHHYRKPHLVFSEAARVLRPGGRLYVVDFMPHNSIVQFLFNLDGCPEPYHFERYYRMSEVESLAQDAGLMLRDKRRMDWFSNAKILLLQKA